MNKDSQASLQIDASLARRLVASQFPHWSDLTVRPVEISGNDNRTFRLGEEMSVRLPSAQRYAAHVETEHQWLPKLAPHLPLPIPTPLVMGRPEHGYPWNWTINSWIEGETATIDRINDPSRFATDLAEFLNVLQSLDATGAPLPGKDNFYRGGDLSVYDSETRECIMELQDLVNARSATAIWESALKANWNGPPVWFHGDVSSDNLLMRDGRLCAVIDFGQIAAGDPSCDVTIAWTFFFGAGREAFREMLSVDEATWVRGRGWGIWKALLQLRKYRETDPAEAAKAMRVIEDILAD